MDHSKTELNKSRFKLLLVYLSLFLTGVTLCTLAYLYGQYKQIEGKTLNQIGEQLIQAKTPLLRAIREKNRMKISKIFSELDIHSSQVWDTDGTLWYQQGGRVLATNPKLAISLWWSKSPMGALVLSANNDKIMLETQARSYNTLLLVASIMIFSIIAFMLSYSLVFFRPLSYINKIVKQEVSDHEAELSGSQQTRFLNFIGKEILGLRSRIRTLSNIHQRQIEEQQNQLDETSKQLFDKQSKLVKQSLQTEKLEIHDALTGVYSRLHFENVLNNETSLALSNKEAYSLIVLQCNLKQINDRDGIKIANAYLCHIANTINKNKQKTDRAFRIGSGQFAIVSKGSSKKEIGLIAQYILSQAREIEGNLSKIHSEIHIGMVSNLETSPYKDAESFLNSALSALHYAQMHNNPCIHFSDIMEKLKSENVTSITEVI